MGNEHGRKYRTGTEGRGGEYIPTKTERRGDYKRGKQRIRYADKGKNAVQVQRRVSRTWRKGNKGQGQRKGKQRRIQDKDKRGEFRTGKKLTVQRQRKVSKTESKERQRTGSKERHRTGRRERQRTVSKERQRTVSKERQRTGSKVRQRKVSKKRQRTGTKRRMKDNRVDGQKSMVR